MQISSVKKEELGLLIHGLRAIYVADHAELRDRLLEQLEQELSTRFGMVLREALPNTTTGR